MTYIHDLLELPEAIRKGDYVQGLVDGIRHPDRTVANFAIPPRIVQTFEHAMSIVGSALKTGRSQAAYLHGSFGSGKSHFMAVLHLMLANHPAPWKRPELHSVRSQFGWIGEKKLLQLPVHMIGASSIEDQVFSSYVRWSAETYPDAPVPPLFADVDLFENARRQRKLLGDEVFFRALNSTTSTAPGWGRMAAAQQWDAARFEAAVASADAGERGKLFDALVKTLFPAFAQERGRFVDLDTGLARLARHASGLGYHAAVLYLDELILWLSGKAADLPFVEREAEKIVKFKEAQDEQRDVPIVTFIARQRRLSEWVGKKASGHERAALEDTLEYLSGKIEEVPMLSGNLPAIIAHRVIRPKDDNAKETLEDGFVKAWKGAGQARSTLVGSEGDESAFRQVYPFSPALVEALVALSDCLQRERTAIRILMELLVEHLPELPLGPVVPVGDAFDVIAGGEDPFDHVMKDRFDRARDLYEERFLPLIRSEHGTETAAKCQRLRDAHKVSLGCSGCPESACRDDNRLAKTLLMSALVPDAGPFRSLTVKRLVHLNHGVINTPIPGAEVQLAAERIREWASQIGPLRVGDQADPEVTLHLEGVDLRPILASAADFDSPGARRQALREILFKALDLSTSSNEVEHTHLFQGTRRKGIVRFGNVREMSADRLHCPNGAEWYLIVDFPFDDAQHGPNDDLRVLDAWKENHDGSDNPTIAWLPTFFSHKLEQDLGDYVVIDHVLNKSDTQKYVGHLRPDDQTRARDDLRGLLLGKRDRIAKALGRAYGIAATSAGEDLLDNSRAVEDHVVSLLSGLRIRGLLAGTMEQGFAQIVDTILRHRYPHHPQFEGTITPQRLGRVGALVERVIEAPNRSLLVQRDERKLLRGVADPLGITVTTDQNAQLEQEFFRAVDRLRVQAGMETPCVADIRSYADSQGTRGLTRDIGDLVAYLYCAWSGRTLMRGGRSVQETAPGRLADDAELVLPELPTETEWRTALDRAAKLFGITFPNRHLGARNLTLLCDKLATALERHTDAANLPAAVQTKLDTWAPGQPASRLTTAEACGELVRALAETTGAEQVRRLASAELATSLTAMSHSLTSTPGVLRALRDEARWLNFLTVRGRLNDPRKANRAQQILDDLAEALVSDDVSAPLVKKMDELTKEAAKLIGGTGGRTATDWRAWHREQLIVEGRERYADKLAEFAQTLNDKLAAEDPGGDVRLVVSAVVEHRKEEE